MAAPADSPVSLDDFSAFMDRLFPSPVPSLAGRGLRAFAVGVSGGADSMALALLLHQWSLPRAIAVQAVTVDHALRPESAEEAAFVSRTLGALGIRHTTLRWEGEKPGTRVQELARAARYRLMGEFCRANNIHHLFLAHHADDQAETFLYRLARGSGLEGLTGIAPLQPMTGEGITLARPLLTACHAALIATCQERGLQWIEDPSNASARFARGRLRGARKVLEREGLTRQRLLTTIERLKRADGFLEQLAQQAYQNCLLEKTDGGLAFHFPRLLALPEEIMVRLLCAALVEEGPSRPYPPRLQNVEALSLRIRGEGESFRGASLGGCLVRLSRDRSLLLVTREKKSSPSTN